MRVELKPERLPPKTRHIKITTNGPATFWVGTEKVGEGTVYEDDVIVTKTIDYTVTADGYKSKVVTFFASDVDQEQHVELEPKPPTERNVRITTNVPARFIKAGVLVGEGTEFSESVPTGTTVEYRVEADGYKPETVTFYASYTDQEEYVELEPLPPNRWKVHVSAVDETGNPVFAKILVNGDFTGAWTPGYVILDPGKYLICVVHPDYETACATVELEELEGGE